MWFGEITMGHNLGKKWPGIQTLPLPLHFLLENWTLKPCCSNDPRTLDLPARRIAGFPT